MEVTWISVRVTGGSTFRPWKRRRLRLIAHLTTVSCEPVTEDELSVLLKPYPWDGIETASRPKPTKQFDLRFQTDLQLG
jgi:hypothetical protein